MSDRDEDPGVTWVPACLSCWRRAFGRRGDPPAIGGWRDERCVLCGKPTDYGVYINYVAALQDMAAEGTSSPRARPRRARGAKTSSAGPERL